jgi:enoyl-CoA hydratase
LTTPSGTSCATRSGESGLLDDGDDALDVLVGKWCFLDENTVASMGAPREDVATCAATSCPRPGQRRARLARPIRRVVRRITVTWDAAGMPEPLTLERQDGIAVLTMRAPATRNALTVAMARAMIDACETIDADAGIGAVIVTGEGPYFCAGGDRATLAAAGKDPADPAIYQAIGTIYGAFARVGAVEPPTIAAIRGGAVGAGLNLALATDLRVVAEDAKLLSGFLPIGLHPGGGHSLLLARSVGRETANALQLFGATITGAEAVERGLAWAAVPAEEVGATARRLAAIPAKDPELARRTARSMRTIAGPPTMSWAAALDLERASQMWSMRRKELAS